MAETHGFRLDAVHQNNADTGEGIHIQFADWLLNQILPGEVLSVERGSFLLQQINGHVFSLVMKEVRNVSSRRDGFPEQNAPLRGESSTTGDQGNCKRRLCGKWEDEALLHDSVLRHHR
jgi:hypothetical protein